MRVLCIALIVIGAVIVSLLLDLLMKRYIRHEEDKANAELAELRRQFDERRKKQ